MEKRKKVFVTGCFDMLHSGHVAFLAEAAKQGDVYVGIGSAETVGELKGRSPVNNQDERRFMREPRKSTFSVLDGTKINADGARYLAEATENCWEAILAADLGRFAKAFTGSFEAQISMFPNMVDQTIRSIIERYRSDAYGWKLSGAGGGGYLIFVAEKIQNSIQIKIRRQYGGD